MKVKSKKKKMLLAGILVVTMGAIGCGISNADESYAGSDAIYESDCTSPMSEEDLYLEEDAGALAMEEEMTDSRKASYNEETEADLLADVETGDGEESESDHKLITSWDMTIETEEYDQTMEDIRQSLEKAGGYIESEDENCYEENRYDCLTIRLPEEAAEDWTSGIDDFGTVLSRSKSSQDVTLTYVDVESRINSLRTEEESLRKLMEEAEEMEDIISIQDRLTNVTYEIESYESQLRAMKNQVNYSTITMVVNEVQHEQTTDRNMLGQIKDRFVNSLTFLGDTLRCLTVNLLGYSVLIAVAAGLIFIFVKIRKVRKNKKGKASPDIETGEKTEKNEEPRDGEV